MNRNLPDYIVAKILKSYDKSSYDYFDAHTSEEKVSFKLNLEDTSSDIKNKISLFLNDIGYDITNFIGGYCKQKHDKRVFKIGRILYQNNAPKDLIHEYENCNQRSNKNKELYLTISRNPFDVTTMSTNKSWTSCTNLFNGSDKNLPYKETQRGTLIVYIHTFDAYDNPLGRTLLRNIKSGKNTIPYFDDIFYGNISDEVKNKSNLVIKNFIKTFLPTKNYDGISIKVIPSSLFFDIDGLVSYSDIKSLEEFYKKNNSNAKLILRNGNYKEKEMVVDYMIENCFSFDANFKNYLRHLRDYGNVSFNDKLSKLI